jgi:hypothetical protein
MAFDPQNGKKVDPTQLVEAIEQSQKLKPEEKKVTLEHIREWYLEDQAQGILVETLLEKFPFLEALFVELGLI